MRLQVLSDLHFEFHADDGRSFVASLDPAGVDVLVLAGDIAVGERVGPALDLLCTRYSEAHVVYVHGNHEFYGTNRAHALSVTRAAVSRHANLVWLDNDVAVLLGRRFLGTPLWFGRPSPQAAVFKRALNDFTMITDFETWVYEENARALAFLDRQLRPGDVVITHHLPSLACVAPEFVASPLNPFFVCDVEPLVRSRRPLLWIHGHTHASVDTMTGATRVVCNPFGYVRREENARFCDKLCVDLEGADKGVVR